MNSILAGGEPDPAADFLAGDPDPAADFLAREQGKIHQIVSPILQLQIYEFFLRK